MVQLFSYLTLFILLQIWQKGRPQARRPTYVLIHTCTYGDEFSSTVTLQDNSQSPCAYSWHQWNWVEFYCTAPYYFKFENQTSIVGKAPRFFWKINVNKFEIVFPRVVLHWFKTLTCQWKINTIWSYSFHVREKLSYNILHIMPAIFNIKYIHSRHFFLKLYRKSTK